MGAEYSLKDGDSARFWGSESDFIIDTVRSWRSPCRSDR